MRKRIIITNQLGESIEICREPYVLSSFDPSGNGADIVKTKGYMQDGISVGNVTLNEMTIPIEFFIKGSNLEEIYQLRQKMNSVINPKLGPFSFVVDMPHGTFTNTVSIESLPKYRVEDERYNIVQRGLFHILLNDPYWKSEMVRSASLIEWEPLFSFPIEMGYMLGNQPVKNIIFGELREVKTLYNDGHVETPIRLKIYGDLKNPIVTNTTTGEKIAINIDIQNGQYIDVNTKRGERTVEIVEKNGTRKNIYNLLTLDSSLFQFQTGSNNLEYTAKIGIETMQVEITYQKRYVGI
ncbi:phage tail family protein [Bacillus cytotoxicus]|uniref:Phage tail family protein n=1 Tax=Bacillus cytotoxicus TaxID=580165 RepID=A0ACC6A8V9_9BACI|nr:phage tail family protein [Bacillus cytotoxicus]